MVTSTLNFVVLRRNNCGVEEKDWAHEEEEDNTTVNTTSSCVTISHSNVTNSHIARENASQSAAIASVSAFLRSRGGVREVMDLLERNMLVTFFRRQYPIHTAEVITNEEVNRHAREYVTNNAVDAAAEFLRSRGVLAVMDPLRRNILVSEFREIFPILTEDVITDDEVIQQAQAFVQQAPPVPQDVAVGQGGGDESSLGSDSHGRRDAGAADAARLDLMQQPVLSFSGARGAASVAQSNGRAASSSSGGTAGAAARAAQALQEAGAIASIGSSIQNLEPVPVASPPRRGEYVEADPEETDNIAGGQPGPVAGAAASHTGNDSSQEEDQKPSASKKQRRE